MEIKDLAGISEPITRLIEVISKGVGAVAAPYLTRKNADAKAHEISAVSAALASAARQHQTPVVYKDGEIELWQKPEDRTFLLDAKPIDERSATRIDYEARQEQENVEKVTSAAAADLVNDESVANESPDDDWIKRFFKYAQDVSSDQMQELWGRILAGEIRRPGQYSLRTLDFIRSISQNEANLIEQISQFAFISSGTAFVDAHDKAWLASERKLPAGMLFGLAELDVMYPTDLALRFFREESVDKEYVFFHDKVMIVERGGITAEVKLTVWKFTSIGGQVLSLAPGHFDEEYIERFGRFFAERKGKVLLAQVDERLPATIDSTIGGTGSPGGSGTAWDSFRQIT